MLIIFEFTAYFSNCKYIDKGVAMFAFPVTAQEIKNSVGIKRCIFEKMAQMISLKGTDNNLITQLFPLF